MNRSVVGGWLEKVPAQIHESIQQLNSNERWALLLYLLDNKYVRIQDICAAFRTDDTCAVRDHLHRLVGAGLARQFVKNLRDVGDYEKTYYCVTPLGKAIIEALFNAVIPPRGKILPVGRGAWTPDEMRSTADYEVIKAGAQDAPRDRALYRIQQRHPDGSGSDIVLDWDGLICVYDAIRARIGLESAKIKAP